MKAVLSSVCCFRFVFWEKSNFHSSISSCFIGHFLPLPIPFSSSPNTAFRSWSTLYFSPTPSFPESSCCILPRHLACGLHFPWSFDRIICSSQAIYHKTVSHSRNAIGLFAKFTSWLADGCIETSCSSILLIEPHFTSFAVSIHPYVSTEAHFALAPLELFGSPLVTFNDNFVSIAQHFICLNGVPCCIDFSHKSFGSSHNFVFWLLVPFLSESWRFFSLRVFWTFGHCCWLMNCSTFTLVFLGTCSNC